MRISILFMVAFLCSFLLNAKDNLVYNGEFSQVNKKKIPYWSRQSWGPPTGEITVVPEQGGKDAVLKIVNNSVKQHSFLAQSVRLESDTSYTISYYIKAENIKGSTAYCGGAVYLLDKGNALFSMGDKLYHHATGTFNWKRVEHNFRTKKLRSSSVALVFSLRAVTGTVWYDKVRIEKKKKIKQTAPQAFLYPVDFQNRNWYLNSNFPNALLLRAKLDRKWMPGNHLQMILDVPEGVEYLGSGALLPVSNAAKKTVFEKDTYNKKAIKRDGKNYVRYTLTFAPGFTEKLGKNFAWENYNRIYFRATGQPRIAGKVYWKLRSRTNETQEQFFVLNVLPPLQMPARPCERFQLCLARLWHMITPAGVSDAYLDFWNSLQKRPWISNPYYINAYPEKEQQKIYSRYHYSFHLPASASMPWITSLYNAVAKNRFPGKFPKAVRADGSKIPISVSPWYLIEDPENLIWETLFKEYAVTVRKNPNIKAIAVDYEPGAYTHCFSQESRKRFAAFAKLKTVPSTDVILVKHREKWLRFRIEEHRKILERLSKAIKKHLPGVQFWLISDPLQPGKQRVAEWCGVDVQASDPDVDIHQDMPYYTGEQFYNVMKLNIAELKKPCFPFIDPSENSEMYYSRYNPATVMQNILIVASLGGYGIGFWPNDVFDGRYLESIKESYRVVAETEKIYALPYRDSGTFRAKCRNVLEIETSSENGKKITLTIPPIDRKIRVLHHQSADADLLTVFNFSDRTSAILELAIPGFSGKCSGVEELVKQIRLTENGKNLSSDRIRKGFLAEIAPNGTAVFRIRKKAENIPGTMRPVEQKYFAGKLKQNKLHASSGTSFRPFKEKDSSAMWGVLPEKDNAVVYLEQQGKGRIGIEALDGGEIVSWEPDGKVGNDLLYHQGRGFFGRFQLNAPEQLPGPYPFELQAIRKTKTGPEVLFEYTVPDYANASAVKNPLTGLKVSKKISLQNAGKKIVLTFTFYNPSKKTMNFSFKVNNYPRIGGNYAEKAHLPGVTQIICGSKSFIPGSPKSDRMLLKNKDAAPELRKYLLYKRIPIEIIKPGAITVKAGKEMVETVKIVPDAKTAGFYSWANTVTGYTVEPISDVLTLQPGKQISWSCSYEIVR